MFFSCFFSWLKQILFDWLTMLQNNLKIEYFLLFSIGDGFSIFFIFLEREGEFFL
jgi:hypothetical protein